MRDKRKASMVTIARWRHCTSFALTAMLAGVGLVAPAVERPRIATRDLGAGQFRYVPDPYSQAPYESQLLLVRLPAGELKVWFIPVREGLRRLPSDAQWSPGWPCQALQPDFAAAVIACHDPALPPHLARRYRWRLDGRALSDLIPDLLPVPGAEGDGAFIIHAPSR